MRNSRQSFQSVSSIFPAFHSRNVLLLPAIITSHIQTAVYFLPVSLLRSFIYIGLMTWWGISLWQRIVQTQVRRYLAATAALCVFWLSIRTVKFFFAATPAAIRYLWYGYYFPMLFIPLPCVFVALSLGRPENYRLPKWTSLFYIPANALASVLGVRIRQDQQKRQSKFYTLPRPKKSHFSEKSSEKRLEMPWVKVQVRRICQSPFWHLFVTPLKMGAKKPGSRSVSLYRDTNCHPFSEGAALSAPSFWFLHVMPGIE